MIYLGKLQTLSVVKKTESGVYLADTKDMRIPTEEELAADSSLMENERILLPKNQAVNGTDNGTAYDVFIYKDSEDRPIATTTVPPLTLHTTALLTVKEVTQIGAFLDWGLLKDLFLPFKEQTYRPAAGDSVLVALYIDKSSRLCATMKVYPYLQTGSPYEKGADVTGRVYEQLDSFGAFVAVDDKYSALIPKKRLFGAITTGDIITAHVEKVQPDGKLELAVREHAYLQTEPDKKVIYDALVSAGGYLPYHDKSDPVLIKEKFALSKAAFKRAVGSLYKEEKITILEDGIRIRKDI